MASPPPSVSDALDQLVNLVGDDRVDAVTELRRRWDDRVLRVLVAGEGKRGKSTLINALLGRAVLPTGVVPLTAIATTVAFGEVEQVEVSYLDLREEVLEPEALAELVTESGNPDNVRRIASVTVRLPAPLLRLGVELVDTPGTGSVYAQNTIEATTARERMDAAIVVLTADPPISAAERDLLRSVRGGAVTAFCVLNKTDRLEAEDLAEVIRFTAQVVSAELGSAVPVWPVSARQALPAVEPQADQPVNSGAAQGWSRFEEAFHDYLMRRRETDLTRSLTSRAARLAREVAGEAAATQAALALSVDDLEQRLQTLTSLLQGTDRDRADIAALGAAEVQRLLATTNEQASALRAGSTPELLTAVTARLQQPGKSAAELERDALGTAAKNITGIVDDFRNGRGHDLDEALADLDQRLSDRLTGPIAAVRAAVADLFGVPLPPAPSAGRLVASRRFSYAFASDPGQFEAIAGAFRSRLPGQWGRRQVTRHVTGQADLLLDRQIGRARADIQERLGETQRLLLRELDRRFVDGAGRIADAVGRANQLRNEQSADRDRSIAGLATRQDSAVALADSLDLYVQQLQ